MTSPTPDTIQAPTRANFASILALGLIWGGTFMVVTIALQGYGPFTVATARLVLGAIALVGLATALKRPLPQASPLLIGFITVIGLFSAALPFLLLSWGQQYVPSAFAGLSMAVLPLFVLPLAHIFVPGDQLSWRKSIGFGLGLIGAVILLGPRALEAGSGDLVALGQLACLGAAVCYACSSILTRRCPPVDPIWLSALSLVAGSAMMLPLMLVVEGLPGGASATTLAAILFLGLVPTAIATLLRVQVIRTAGPSFMTLVNYQVPLWAMFFGAVVLSEALPGRFFLALGLILAGLVISQWRNLRGMFDRP